MATKVLKISSNINEGIKAVLNVYIYIYIYIFFFLRKDFARTKKH